MKLRQIRQEKEVSMQGETFSVGWSGKVLSGEVSLSRDRIRDRPLEKWTDLEVGVPVGKRGRDHNCRI